MWSLDLRCVVSQWRLTGLTVTETMSPLTPCVSQRGDETWREAAAGATAAELAPIVCAVRFRKRASR